MEDGPESLEGSYRYGDQRYRIEERESEQWWVYDGQVLRGILKAMPGGRMGPMYTVKFAEVSDFQDELTDDWRAALEYLIEGDPEG